MSKQGRKPPSWMAELLKQVDEGLKRLTTGKHDQQPALEHEMREIDESIRGWNASLAKPQLPTSVREAIETQWATAIERKHEIEAQLNEMHQVECHAEQLVRPGEVIRRIDRLADVLAANDPTRGNLELSLHIDRIICCRDRRVTLRMCKLGIMPDVVELLGTPAAKSASDVNEKTTAGRARRRGKLRVVDDDAEVDLRAQASFVADVDRFAGLDDEWFWLDEFTIPESTSWAADNAETVFRRRKAENLSYAKLAKEFGVTPPTIGAAVRLYLAAHPEETDIELARGGKRRPKFDLSTFADEAKELWLAGVSKEALAKKYGCSAPTVDKAIAFAYEQNESNMPTREDIRRDKAAEARRFYDAGKSLDDIAASMKISDTTARQHLRNSFAAEGKAMPDLRRRPRRGPDAA